ncbi:MAG: element excision factor XisI family protein [Nostoc sp. CreGUA01]|nr:element excision factor XisI family protein [Nostoc sp. CreGUA01]
MRDRTATNYIVMTLGWQGEQRVHGCIIHIEIINGKIWIQRDGTEYGIANELVAAGIVAFGKPQSVYDKLSEVSYFCVSPGYFGDRKQA